MVIVKKPLILRTIFTGAKLPHLAIFVANVVNKMSGNKKYQELQDAITEVKAKLDTFNEALVAAEDALPNVKKRRDEAHEALIFTLHLLSSGIEFFSRGDLEYIEETGMTAQTGEKSRRKVSSMVPPQFTKVVASKIPGHVDLEYTAIEGTKVYGFEYSEDQITWKNGQYSHITSASVEIPTRKEIFLRCRAIGPHKAQSEFSAVAQIFIA
jgi:hypothetical protein